MTCEVATMLKSLARILKIGIITEKEIFPDLNPENRGLPSINKKAWDEVGKERNRSWVELCPTGAIEIVQKDTEADLTIDLGRCIACGLCPDIGPDGVIEKNLSSQTSVNRRQDLVLSTRESENQKLSGKPPESIFERSIAVRVVSTGCSACDLEINAAFNPIFDLERFGVQLVASPRLADVLMVTGPVADGMKKAVLRTFEAMPEPRKVIAVGTCAISGGIHGQNDYASTGGIDSILPVDAYVPGCPPHPWSIIHSVLHVMNKRLTPKRQ